VCGKVLFLLGSQEAKKREEKRERSILLLPGNVNIMNPRLSTVRREKTRGQEEEVREGYLGGVLRGKGVTVWEEGW